MLSKMSCNISKVLIILISFIVLICGMPPHITYKYENRTDLIMVNAPLDKVLCADRSWDLDSYYKAFEICKDCEDLFGHHTPCSDECFTTNFFKGCLDALQFNQTSIDEMRNMVQSQAGFVEWGKVKEIQDRN